MQKRAGISIMRTGLLIIELTTGVLALQESTTNPYTSTTTQDFPAFDIFNSVWIILILAVISFTSIIACFCRRWCLSLSYKRQRAVNVGLRRSRPVADARAAEEDTSPRTMQRVEVRNEHHPYHSNDAFVTDSSLPEGAPSSVGAFNPPPYCEKPPAYEDIYKQYIAENTNRDLSDRRNEGAHSLNGANPPTEGVGNTSADL